jgi:hypothetical protein
MADMARTLFDGKSDAILSKHEMIRDLPQRGCCKVGNGPSQCPDVTSCAGPSRERDPRTRSFSKPTINWARSVVKRQERSLTDTGISFTLIRTFQSALNSMSPISHI